MNAERRLHDRAIELAARAIDLPLDAAEREELERHLATCAVCARGVTTMRHHAAALAATFAPLPPRRVDDAVLAAISARTARTQRTLVLVAAAALLLVALLGIAAAGSFIVRNWPKPPEVVVPPAEVIAPTPTVAADGSLGPIAEASASPTSSPDASATPSGPPATLPPTPPVVTAGAAHELACDVNSTNCLLHLRDAAGSEQPGWPVALNGTCWDWGLTTAADGTAFVACDSAAASEVSVSAFDASGRPLAGWPVVVAGRATTPLWNDFGIGCGISGKAVEVTERGAVFVAVSRPERSEDLVVASFARDGRPRAGWPQAIGTGKCPGFSVAGDGTVVGWWYEGGGDSILLDADRTKYTMLASSGTPLAGWPITSIGAASGPVVADDGSIYYTSATGKVWGHDRSGTVIDGWPYVLPDKVAPALAPDGRLLFFVLGPQSAWWRVRPASIIALTQAGRPVSGWPYETSSSGYAGECATPSVDYVPYAFGADGTLFVPIQPADASDRGSVIALDRHAALVAGWPFRLAANTFVRSIRAEPARLVVTISQGSCGEANETTIPILPDGAPAP